MSEKHTRGGIAQITPTTLLWKSFDETQQYSPNMRGPHGKRRN